MTNPIHTAKVTTHTRPYVSGATTLRYGADCSCGWYATDTYPTKRRAQHVADRHAAAAK